MARVVVTPEATAALDRLIVSHSLPADTQARFRRSIRPLETFPLSAVTSNATASTAFASCSAPGAGWSSPRDWRDHVLPLR